MAFWKPSCSSAVVLRLLYCRLPQDLEFGTLKGVFRVRFLSLGSYVLEQCHEEKSVTNCILAEELGGYLSALLKSIENLDVNLHRNPLNS